MRFMPLLTLLLLIAGSLAFADDGVDTHECAKPAELAPGELRGRVTEYKRQVEAYKRCIREYSEQQQKAAEAHHKAAEDAIQEWNSFVRDELQK